MQEYLNRVDTGITKKAARCDEFRKKISDLEQQNIAAQAERESLSKVVEKQNLSDVDIHRLTSDRQALDSSLRARKQEREERSRKVYDLEIKRSQVTNSVERLVEAYEQKFTKLGLIPSPPAEYASIDFYQELHSAAAQPAAMVPNEYLVSQIKPAVAKMKVKAVEIRRENEDKILGVEEEVQDLRDKIAMRSQETEESETRYKLISADLNASKEVSTLIRRLLHTLHQLVRVRTDRCPLILSVSLQRDVSRLRRAREPPATTHEDAERALGWLACC